MRKDKKKKEETKIKMAPEVFLVGCSNNFMNASKAFEALSAWCDAALYLKKLGERVKEDPINTLDLEEINKMTVAMSLMANPKYTDEALEDIDKALSALKLLTQIDLNLEDFK